MNIPTEGNIISVTLTLFMLSLITEKIANFIKLNMATLFVSSSNPVEEKIRERKIQFLTAAVGVGVALLCNADFFNLITEQGKIDPLTALTLKGVTGCGITGLFLSQGSKFFHDLLDTIFYLKNAKKAIYSKQEIENTMLLQSGNLTAGELIQAITANQRQDDEDVSQ